MENNSICCGNDLMNLVNSFNIEKTINTDALSMYFRYHYINPPQTVFKNIYTLEHGHYLIYKNSEMFDNTYWDITDKFNNNSKILEKDFDIAKNKLNDSICLFIKDIVEKEENYGVYISGGIDSSIVAAICAKYSNKKVNTFSIGFYDEECNEAEKSKIIAEYLGTNHHELYISREDILKIIKKY